MRRFGSTRKNPNPQWPAEQSVVVIPPGSTPAAVGKSEQKRRTMMTEAEDAQRLDVDEISFSTVEETSGNERMIRKDPIMGNMYNNNSTKEFSVLNNQACLNGNINNYLCGQIGKYVKIEFLFGENIHMEKYGKLKEVGKDFIAIQENGTDNTIVCGIGKIKFINIYEFNL